MFTTPKYHYLHCMTLLSTGISQALIGLLCVLKLVHFIEHIFNLMWIQLIMDNVIVYNYVPMLVQLHFYYEHIDMIMSNGLLIWYQLYASSPTPISNSFVWHSKIWIYSAGPLKTTKSNFDCCICTMKHAKFSLPQRRTYKQQIFKINQNEKQSTM